MTGCGARHRRRSPTHLWTVRIAAWICVTLGACTADPGYGGRSSEQWIAQLAEADAGRRIDAALALGRVLSIQPNAPKVIGALVVALADTSDDVRVTAAEGLRSAARGDRGIQSRLARDAVPRIEELLGDSQHVAVRRDAARILGSLGPSATAVAVAPLGRALQDPSPEVRRAAAMSLTGSDEAARAAVPRLLDASRDTDREVRLIVLRALAASAEPTILVGQAIIRGLRDPDAVVREGVATGLGQRRPQPTGTLFVPDGPYEQPLLVLRAATRDPVTSVRLAAVMSLGLLADSTGRVDLERALADPDSAVRREAVHALTALHRRGGRDPSLPEPSLFELCRSNPRWPGC